MISKNCPKLDLNVTNNCNLRCLHCCFRSGETLLVAPSLATLTALLDNFKSLGGKRVDITGGEPCLRSDLAEIISKASDLGLVTELVTNGTLLTRHNLQRFKDCGLYAVAISIDGAYWPDHERIRGINKKGLNKIWENVGHSVDLGLRVKINTVVFTVNLDQLVDIAVAAVDYDVHEHGLYFFSPIGRGEEIADLVADPRDWLKIIRRDLAPLEEYIKISVEVPLLENTVAAKLNTTCYLLDPWHLQFLPGGNIYPCAIMAAYQKPLGCFPVKSLTVIWQDPELHNGGYHRTNVAPLFNDWGSCVSYPRFKPLLQSGQYQPVCLCRKFSPKELSP